MSDIYLIKISDGWDSSPEIIPTLNKTDMFKILRDTVEEYGFSLIDVNLYDEHGKFKENIFHIRYNDFRHKDSQGFQQLSRIIGDEDAEKIHDNLTLQTINEELIYPLKLIVDDINKDVDDKRALAEDIQRYNRRCEQAEHLIDLYPNHENTILKAFEPISQKVEKVIEEDFKTTDHGYVNYMEFKRLVMNGNRYDNVEHKGLNFHEKIIDNIHMERQR